MRRTSIAIALLAATWLAAVPEARAGGSWLEIDPGGSAGAGGEGPWDAWASWGATVTMRAVGNDWPHGTYETYLRAEGDGSLVHVGEATAGDAAHFVGAITTTFIVPEVAPGPYVVLVCSGDFPSCEGFQAQGWLVIGETPSTAVLRLQVDTLTEEVDVLRSAKGVRAHKLAAAETKLAHLEERLLQRQREASTLALQRDLARMQRDEATRQARKVGAVATEALADAGRWRFIGTVAIVALAVVLLVGWLRLRHTIRVRIPDSPEELVEFGAPRE